MAAEEDLAALRREYAEFRAKTVEVAQRYALQHNLCQVVDRALNEIGLLGRTVIKTFHVQVPLAVTLEIDEHSLVGLSDNEIQALFEGSEISSVEWSNVSPGAVRAVANGTRVTAAPVTTQDGEITVLSVEDAPEQLAREMNLTATGMWGYTSNEGRVMHFYTNDVIQREARFGDVFAICGRGQIWAGRPRAESARGGGRRCTACERRA